MRRARGLRILVPLLLFGLAATCIRLVAPFFSAPAPVLQPIAFNHALHVKQEDLECTECHSGAPRQVSAGFPDLKDCADCHQQAEGTHPDEPKVREYAKRGEQIPWVQVTRNEGHVYFSHRAHVGIAKMKCQECHGEMEKREVPPERPQPSLRSMDVCIDCHLERQASVECASCHK